MENPLVIHTPKGSFTFIPNPAGDLEIQSGQNHGIIATIPKENLADLAGFLADIINVP